MSTVETEPATAATSGASVDDAAVAPSAAHGPRKLDLGVAARNLAAGGHLRRALERVKADPEAADEAVRAQQHADANEVRALQRHNRWAAYAQARPSDYVDIDYASLHPQQNPKGKVTAWWASGAHHLLLAGPAGHGKTACAYAVGNEVARADRDGSARTTTTVRAVRAVDLRELFLPPDAHEARDEGLSAARDRDLRALRDADLLLLDDLCNASWTPGVAAGLFALVDYRANRPHLRTIVTLNSVGQSETMPRMEEALGSPIASRLTKDCVPAWIEGDSLRTFSTRSLDF